MKISALIPALLLLAACNNSNNQKQPRQYMTANKLLQLSWLHGNWEMKTEKGTVIETWLPVSDSLFRGASYFITPEHDTIAREEIKLILVNNTLYYVPQISDQNSGRQVVFKEKTFGDDAMSFENPMHDFPKLIAYKKLSDTSIYAVVSGGPGSKKEIEFHYKRINK